MSFGGRSEAAAALLSAGGSEFSHLSPRLKTLARNANTRADESQLAITRHKRGVPRKPSMVLVRTVKIQLAAGLLYRISRQLVWRFLISPMKSIGKINTQVVKSA